MMLYSYEEYIDDDGEDSSYAWDDFKVNTETELDHLSYPITLEAINSNWRGQTGYAEVENFDDLLRKVWKEPGFFLAHPDAIAAFGRECTRRGVPPPTVSLFGSQFITWRGIPLIPSNKIPVEGGKTKIILLRVGEKRQGVVGLFQPGLAVEQAPGLSVRFMGINHNAIASYLISLYCSLAVLTDDALAVLEDVEVDKYHDYPTSYK